MTRNYYYSNNALYNFFGVLSRAICVFYWWEKTDMI